MGLSTPWIRVVFCGRPVCLFSLSFTLSKDLVVFLGLPFFCKAFGLFFSVFFFLSLWCCVLSVVFFFFALFCLSLAMNCWQISSCLYPGFSRCFCAVYAVSLGFRSEGGWCEGSGQVRGQCNGGTRTNHMASLRRTRPPISQKCFKQLPSGGLIFRPLLRVSVFKWGNV